MVRSLGTPGAHVAAVIGALEEDLAPSAVKIGMLGMAPLLQATSYKL